MMKKTVAIDVKTLVGNPWLKARGITEKISYSVDRNSFDGSTDGPAFYISQLSWLEKEIYQTKYAQITYLNDIPVLGGVPEAAQSIMYRSYDGVALGKFIGASAKDLPVIAATAKASEVRIGYGGNKMEYSLEELRSAAFTGMRLDSHQFELGFRAAQEHAQRVAYYGDASKNMHGLFNHPNVPKTNANKAIGSMTGQELFNMVNDTVFQVITDSKLNHLPNTVLVSPEIFKVLNGTFMTQIADKNALQYFKENNYFTQQTGQPITILPRLALQASELAENGVQNGGKDRIMVYENNSRNLTTIANMPYRTLAPQFEGLSISVPAEYKAAGTEFRYPMAAKYLDMA